MSNVTLPVVEIDMTQALDLALATWGQMYDATFQAIVEKYGEEDALEFLRPFLEKIGESAPVFAEMMGIKGRNAITIGSIFDLYESSVLKTEGEVTEANADRVVKKITQCPFQSLSPGFCKSFTCISEGMARAINPEYRLISTKMMSQGDPYCEWIVERK